jgi:hypothetical protein
MSLQWTGGNNCLACGSGLSEQEHVKRVEGGYLCECCDTISSRVPETPEGDLRSARLRSIEEALDDDPIDLAGWRAYWAWMLKEWETVLCVVALLLAVLWGIEVSR